EDERVQAVTAPVRIDGGQVYEPALTMYLLHGIDVPTPSVNTTWNKDIYLALERGASEGDTSARVEVSVRPLIMWLWIGGGVMAVGPWLAPLPTARRRRPTDPVAARIPAGTAGETAGDPLGDGTCDDAGSAATPGGGTARPEEPDEELTRA